MADGPLVFKQVIAQIDDRTTVICLDAAGTIQRVDKPFETMNGDFMSPPFHYGCRSNVAPWMPGMINEQRQMANAELQNRPLSQRDKRNFRKIGAPEPQPTVVSPVEEDILGPHLLEGDEAFDSVPDPTFDMGLSEENTEAADWYVEGGYKHINNYLRGKEVSPYMRDTAEMMAQSLDDTFALSPPLEQPIRVWRGLTSSGDLDGSAVGIAPVDKAFMSTSTTRDIASDFAFRDEDTGLGGSGVPVLMEIEVPRSARVFRPAKVGMSDNDWLTEREVLLPRGSRLRIVEDTFTRDWQGRRIRLWRAIVE